MIRPRSARHLKFGHYQDHLRSNPRKDKLVVDWGASMHMLTRKGLNSAELETVRLSRNPTTGITANGEVQTNEEATEKVHDIELFVTLLFVEDTPAVLSSGKRCEEHGCSMSGPVVKKPQLTHKWPNKSVQNRKFSCRLLFQDWRLVPPAPAQARLPHRFRRTRLVKSLQVQQHNEVTIRNVQASRNRWRDLPEWVNGVDR